MITNKIAIAKLAGMVQKGFNDVAKHLNGIDERLDGIDSRLDKLDGCAVNLESDMSYLKSRVEEIGRTLNRHEEILEEHAEELKWLRKKIDEFTDPESKKRLITYEEYAKLETKVLALEKKVEAKK